MEKENDTHDGTGVRDYIHVKAIEYLDANENTDSKSWNRYRILDVVKAFEKVDRRAGDIAKCFAKEILAWVAKR